jgi:uncharacterized protein (TIGR03083 family)
MPDSLDRAITSLRTHHDRLVEVVGDLTPEQLSGPSAASDWTIAQVLSHLGSGAEIFLPRYAAGVAGEEAPEGDNQAVWARWDASSPEEQASDFLEQDAKLVTLVEALSTDQRDSTHVDLGFTPEPVPLLQALAMRLNEVALHTWDVLAGLDESATVDAEAADLMLEQLAGPAGFLLGWIGKADQLTEHAVVDLDGYTLTVDDAVSLSPGSDEAATATFHGPHEAAYRLFTGRLKDGYTPDEVTVSGNVDLADLRRAFPGY